jgi:hypothetical protein
MKLQALTVWIAMAFAALAQAQVPLAPLWPNDDGLRWDYDLHVVDLMDDLDLDLAAFLSLEGTATTPGGEAQNLIAVQQELLADLPRSQPALPPILLAVWRGRPDLRSAIEARYGGRDILAWYPTFLHGGYFMKSDEDIQMWQDGWSHPTWTYLEVPVITGHTFVQQLLPEIVDDIYLHGTVADTDAEVTTPAGQFTGAVKMDYLVDLGLATLVNEQGELIGTSHGEYRGYVHYVPQVGPVNLFEEFIPFVWADCPGDCPPEIQDLVGVAIVTVSMDLRTQPIGQQRGSWGAVKLLYRGYY